MLSHLERLPTELLSSILEDLPVSDRMSVARTCKGLNSVATRSIYRVMKLPFTPRYEHLVEDLVKRMSGATSYVQELQIGEDVSHTLTGNQRSLTLELVKKLPNLRKLIWMLNDETVFRAIKFIDLARPSCKVMLCSQIDKAWCMTLPLYESYFQRSDYSWLQFSDCVLRIVVCVDTNYPEILVDTRDMLLACRKLRHLELRFEPPISWEDTDASEDDQGLQAETVFSRLESLVLSGLRTNNSRQQEPLLGRDPVDLSQLTTLDAKDDSHFWWLNPTLRNLKEYVGELASGADEYTCHTFRAFLNRNASLRALDVRGLLEHGELAWLAPLKNLHTLTIRKAHGPTTGIPTTSGHMSSKDFFLLAKLLPNLRSLSFSVDYDGTWPYKKLTEVAHSLPGLHHLTLKLSGPTPTVADQYYNPIWFGEKPAATLTLVAASWCHLWKEISSNMTPRLKTLTIIAKYPSRLTSNSKHDLVFRANLSENFEEAIRGVALVSCLDIAPLESALRNLQVMQNHRMARHYDEELWTARRSAEWGPPWARNWRGGISPDDVDADFGRRMIATPEPKSYSDGAIAANISRPKHYFPLPSCIVL